MPFLIGPRSFVYELEISQGAAGLAVTPSEKGGKRETPGGLCPGVCWYPVCRVLARCNPASSPIRTLLEHFLRLRTRDSALFREYEKKLREQQERSLRRKAAALGYDLVSKATTAPEPVSP